MDIPVVEDKVKFINKETDDEINGIIIEVDDEDDTFLVEFEESFVPFNKRNKYAEKRLFWFSSNTWSLFETSHKNIEERRLFPVKLEQETIPEPKLGQKVFFSNIETNEVIHGEIHSIDEFDDTFYVLFEKNFTLFNFQGFEGLAGVHFDSKTWKIEGYSDYKRRLFLVEEEENNQHEKNIMNVLLGKDTYII